MRVAILHHPLQSPERYILGRIASRWREWGIQVLHLDDPARHQDAELAILHVDMTRIPAPYLAWAARYPRSLNGRPMDIGKRAISRHLVTREDPYDGPVIVKTDLNFGGRPERELAKRSSPPASGWLGRLARRGASAASPLPLDPAAYPIYAHPREVPRAYWDDPALVVERFLPERSGPYYCLRKLWCLGSRTITWRAVATRPIVKAAWVVRREPLPLCPIVDAWRRDLGLEFGKIDYVQFAGAPVILDVNPTPGCGAGPLPVGVLPMVEQLAPAIHELLAGADGGATRLPRTRS